MREQRDGVVERAAPNAATVRVVCVDDEPGFAETVSAALEHVDCGIRATAAGRAEDALQHVRDGDFDCVVSDYEMPGRDGAWLCDRLSELGANVPFVLYTANPESALPLGEDPKLDGVTAVVRKDHGMSHYAVLAEHLRRAVAVETEW